MYQMYKLNKVYCKVFSQQLWSWYERNQLWLFNFFIRKL